MTIHWAIDLGTSNTVVCEDRSGRPHVVNLPELVKLEPVTQTPVIPTCVCVMSADGKDVLIGQKAVEYNWDGKATGFVAGFKRYLGREAGRTLGRVGHRTVTAERAAELFLRELVAQLEEQSGKEVRDVTIAAPAGVYEPYRAALQDIVRRIDHPTWWGRLWARLTGGRRDIVFRTIDEPVAAALGYGVDLAREATLVAFDFGGGTMEAAALRSRGKEAVSTGRAEVLAKQTLQLGGTDVDRWILESFVPTALHDWPEWSVALGWEAERVKLLASAGREGTFTFRNESFGTLDYAGLVDILRARGLYDRIRELLSALVDELGERHGIGVEAIDDVILEGGSTLLPEVRNVVGEVVGRDKVREWMPFEAVARGACVFAAGAEIDDFIYHDYALRVLPEGEGDAEYELLIPGGTAYPTEEEFVTRYYSAGFDGQSEINLFICEVGRVAGQRVRWEQRASGARYFVPRTDGERAFCICLNEADPAISLTPPGSGTAPRLRVTYSINEDRWLCVTVHDLRRKADLFEQRPVVRLR